MKRTMTLNLTEVEMELIERMCKQKGISKTAIVRQSLRLYDTVGSRMLRGDKVFVESADKSEKTELFIL